MVLFVAVVITVNAQSDSLYIDSLKKVLIKQKVDTNKVNTLNELANKLWSLNDFTQSLPYAKEALSISEKLNFKKGKASACYSIGYINTYRGQYNNSEGLRYFLSALAIWDKNTNEKEIANAHYDIANIYGAEGNYSEAIKNLYSALKLFEKLKDKKRIASCTFYIGLTNSSQGNHSEALKNDYMALNLFQEIKDKVWIAYSYQSISQENLAIGNYSEAFKNQLYALKIFEKMSDRGLNSDILNCYVGIGNIFEKQGDFLSAKGNKTVAATKYFNALEKYMASLKRFREVNNVEEVARLNFLIGNLYIKLDRFSEAKDCLESSLEFSRSRENIKECYNSLSHLDSAQKNFKQAYEHYKMYILYRDSLMSQETAKQIVQSKIQYDFDKKQAILKAEQDKKDADAKRIKNQQYFAIVALGIVVLAVIIISLIQFRNNKHKQQANIALQHQKEKVETTLSELKSTQAQLIQSEKMASLGELTAGIAHEIQNPLNFVNNFSEVNKELIDEMNDEMDKGNIKEAKTIASDLQQNLEKINHHGRRADAIVKGMLQHSQQSKGLKEPTDVNALADEYLRLSYHGIRAKDKDFYATIKTEFDKDLSSVEGEINIIPQDIGRVLLNLYNNAFYAVNEKTKQQPNSYDPMISVTTKKINNKIEIKISDNGSGIPKNIVDKIFQPFFTTKPTGQGTGLGLSLSYDIIKAHGGEIKVESKEGEGSEFVILIPNKLN